MPDAGSITDDHIPDLELVEPHLAGKTILSPHPTTSATAPNQPTRYLTLIISLCLFALFVCVIWYYWPTLLFYFSM